MTGPIQKRKDARAAIFALRQLPETPERRREIEKLQARTRELTAQIAEQEKAREPSDR